MFSVEMERTFLMRLPAAKFVLQTDPENSIKDVSGQILTSLKRTVSIRSSPGGSHESNGSIERVPGGTTLEGWGEMTRRMNMCFWRCRRTPESEQILTDDQFLLRMTATPWSTKGDGYSENSTDRVHAEPTVPTSDGVVVPVSVPDLRPVRSAEFAPGCSACSVACRKRLDSDAGVPQVTPSSSSS